MIYSYSYLNKRMNHEMVHYKFGHRIDCEIVPKIEGPRIFVLLKEIENSNDSEKVKEEKRKEIESYFKELKRKEKFNKIVYWIPRKVEEMYWRIKE